LKHEGELIPLFEKRGMGMAYTPLGLGEKGEKLLHSFGVKQWGFNKNNVLEVSTNRRPFVGFGHKERRNLL